MGSLCPFKLLCWELLLPLHLPLKEEAGDTLLETSRDALVTHQVYWHLQCGLAAPETQRSKRFSSPPRRWRQSKRRHFSGLKTPYHDSISWPGGASRHWENAQYLGTSGRNPTRRMVSFLTMQPVPLSRRLFYCELSFRHLCSLQCQGKRERILIYFYIRL